MAENPEHNIESSARKADLKDLLYEGGKLKPVAQIRSELKDLLVRKHGRSETAVERKLTQSLDQFPNSEKDIARIASNFLYEAAAIPANKNIERAEEEHGLGPQQHPDEDVLMEEGRKINAERVKRRAEKEAAKRAERLQKEGKHEAGKTQEREAPAVPEAEKATETTTKGVGDIAVGGFPNGIESFQEYLAPGAVVEETGKPETRKPAPLELVQLTERRIQSLDTPFHVAGIKFKTKIKEKLAELGRADEYKSLNQEAKRLQEFFKLAASSNVGVDPLVVQSRFAQMKDFVEKTEQFYHSLETDLQLPVTGSMESSSETDSARQSDVESADTDIARRAELEENVKESLQEVERTWAAEEKQPAEREHEYTLSPEDQEFKNGKEEWLDAVSNSMLDQVPNPTLLASMQEYKDLSELSDEIRALLEKAVEDAADGTTNGMYGEHTYDVFPKELRDTISEKQLQIKELVKTIYGEFNLPNNLSEDADSEEVPFDQTEKDWKQMERTHIRREWKAARDKWSDAKQKYAEALQKDENRGVFKRMLGIGKMPPGEFEEMQAEYRAARQQYAQALSRSFNAVQAGRGVEVPEDKSKQLFFRKYVEKEAKSIVDIQTSALEGKKQSIFFKAAASWSRKPKWVRYIGSAALGSALALTTGGGSLASYAVRFGLGVTVGKIVGELGHAAYYNLATKGVKKQERVVTERGSDSSGFDISNIDASEAGYRGEVKRLSDLKRRRETGSRVVGAASAFAAGGFIAGNIDTNGFSPVDSPEISGAPPVEPEPPVGGSSAPSEAPPESGPPVDGETPEATPVPPPSSEIPPEARYEVQPDDNIWNIMEDRYADMLDDYPTEESRRVFLDTLKDYLATEQASREALGVGPNIDLIHPGQVLDFSSMDTLAEAVHNEMLGSAGVGEAGPVGSETVGGGAIVHSAEPGDNGWNIMEGTGPDANPIGGKSEVLHGMSQAEREHALDTLFDYMEEDKDFTRSVGFSSGDPHKLAVGDSINVSMMDEKLRELLGMEEATAEDHAEAAAEMGGGAESGGDGGPTAGGEVTEDGSPRVTSVAEEPTVGEETESAPATTAPEGRWLPPEVLQERNEIIREVEGTKGLLDSVFGYNSAGTFEKLQSISMEEIERANADPAEQLNFSRKYNIPERAFDEWMDWTAEAEQQYDFPPPRNMTFGEYVTAVAERRAPQGTIV